MTCKYALILDPTTSYGVNIISILEKETDFTPLIVYTNKFERIYREKFDESLQVLKKFKSYQIEKMEDLETFINDIKECSAIEAVIPWLEYHVEPLSKVSDVLSLEWNSFEVMKRFRNKHSLKKQLVKFDIPMNQTYLIKDYEEFNNIFEKIPNKFILKPNSGCSSIGVDVFYKNDAKKNFQEYFKKNSEYQPFILEEFLEGLEYCVNGQMDESGKAHIFNIFKYHKVKANGKSNIYFRDWHLFEKDEIFLRIEEYAKKSMEATMLVRSPFHMEIIYTPNGPILVEVGARLAGDRTCEAMNDIYGNKLDVIKIATEFYVGPKSSEFYKFEGLNFINPYYAVVCGISYQDGYITQVLGKKDVANSKFFKRWSIEPVEGDKLNKTVDLSSVPYVFHVYSDQSEQHLSAICMEMDKSIQLKTSGNFFLKLKIKTINIFIKMDVRFRLLMDYITRNFLPSEIYK